MTQTHLIISTQNDLLRVSAKHVLYVQADANYCTLFLSGGEMRLVSYQLGQMEKMISEQLPELRHWFVRIGKSLIINTSYVFYINVSKQQLVLADDAQNKYTLTASKEALKQLKELIEKGTIV